LRTVLREIPRSRAISLIDLPWTKGSRRIRPTVSTTIIPRHLLQTKAGSPTADHQGSIFHAETQPFDLSLKADRVGQPVQAIADNSLYPLQARCDEGFHQLICDCLHESAPFISAML
jgi:hypothetical protein